MSGCEALLYVDANGVVECGRPPVARGERSGFMLCRTHSRSWDVAL